MKVLILIIFTLAALTQAVDYSGHEVVEVVPKTASQLKELRKLQEEWNGDFWNYVTNVNNPVYIQIPPENKAEKYKNLANLKLTFRVKIHDIQELLDSQKKSREKNAKNRNYRFSLDSYNDLDKINEYLLSLSESYPDVSYSSAGLSVEGRPVNLFTMGTGNKPAVFIDCTNHAREWVSTSTCLNIITDLVVNYTVEANITALRDNLDWYIIPVLNPDGYDYTWTDDRMWRKSRLDMSESSGCFGVDLNRNFASNFGGVGSSGDPCEFDYRGASPISEPESKAMASVIHGIRRNLLASWSLHSFGQLYLLPYHFTGDLPEDYAELQ